MWQRVQSVFLGLVFSVFSRRYFYPFGAVCSRYDLPGFIPFKFHDEDKSGNGRFAGQLLYTFFALTSILIVAGINRLPYRRSVG